MTDLVEEFNAKYLEQGFRVECHPIVVRYTVHYGVDSKVVDSESAGGWVGMRDLELAVFDLKVESRKRRGELP